MASHFSTKVSLTSLLALSLYAQQSVYSKCTDLPPPEAALKVADAVFAGKVVDKGFPRFYYDDSTPFSFEVSEVWKGEVESRTVVFTGSGRWDYGYRFELGGEYLVYVYRRSSRLSTNICSRTTPLLEARQDLAALGMGRRFSFSPAPKPMSKVVLLAALLGAGVLLLAALIWALRRRQPSI